MPVLLAILAAIGGAIWWYVRNNPREAIDTAADLVTTAANAPRRLAFRKQTKAHPVEGIDDERIAICAIAQSFLELDALPTQEKRDQLHLLVRTKLRTSEEDAQEMAVLGRWLMSQCNSPADAITRLGRRIKKIDTGQSWGLLQDVLMPLVDGDLTASQTDAITDLKHILTP